MADHSISPLAGDGADESAPAHVFRQASVRGLFCGPVKKLPGFQKHHHVPDNHFPAAETFIRKIGHVDVEEQAVKIHEAIRATFGFKRKELQYDCDEGTAEIKTPDFIVNLQLGQDPDDAGGYVLTSEVGNIRTPEVVMGEAFSQLFSKYCNTVVVAFAERVSVEDKIDMIEDLPELEPYLSYEPDGNSLTLKLPDPGVQFYLDADEMSFKLTTRGDLQLLLGSAQRVLTTLG